MDISTDASWMTNRRAQENMSSGCADDYAMMMSTSSVSTVAQELLGSADLIQLFITQGGHVWISESSTGWPVRETIV